MQERELFKKMLSDDMIDYNSILMKYHRKLGLSETDFFVLSSLIRQFTRKNNLFNVESLKRRTKISKEDFFRSLEYLSEKEYIVIKKDINPVTKKECEYFFLDNLFDQIVGVYLDQIKKDSESEPNTFEEWMKENYKEIWNEFYV